MSDSPYNHFRCGGKCATALGPVPLPLTLADKELITGRSITQLDEETGIWFCTDCLADLPKDRYAALFHVCGEQDARPKPATPPVPVEHKTRTTEPTGYVYDSGGCRRTDKRGRLMYDKSSWAICTCGWVAVGATREEARQRARAHREEQAALAPARNAA